VSASGDPSTVDVSSATADEVVPQRQQAAVAFLGKPLPYHRSADFAFLERVAEKLTVRLPSLATDTRLASGWAGLSAVHGEARTIAAADDLLPSRPTLALPVR
jgi:hypothetical protein